MHEHSFQINYMIEHSNKFDTVIENSKVLDLFSGSGSFGVECISRNANKVTFVENYRFVFNQHDILFIIFF